MAVVVNLDVRPRGSDLELVMSNDQQALSLPAEERELEYLGKWRVIAEGSIGLAFRCGVKAERLYVFTAPVAKKGVNLPAYEQAEKRLYASLGMVLGQEISATKQPEGDARVPNVVHHVTI